MNSYHQLIAQLACLEHGSGMAWHIQIRRLVSPKAMSYTLLLWSGEKRTVVKEVPAAIHPYSPVEDLR